MFAGVVRPGQMGRPASSTWEGLNDPRWKKADALLRAIDVKPGFIIATAVSAFPGPHIWVLVTPESNTSRIPKTVAGLPVLLEKMHPPERQFKNPQP